MQQRTNFRKWIKYLSFIVLDLACLHLAFFLACGLYLGWKRTGYADDDYVVVALVMSISDVLVTIVFNTLYLVLRRGIRRELIQTVKHVVLSFVFLALFLFSTKQGSVYSRVTIYLMYAIDAIFVFTAREIWKLILKKHRKKREPSTALLITTTGYAAEGLEALKKTDTMVKGMFITDKVNEGAIQDVPVLVDRKEAIDFLCWEWIDKLFICGPEGMDIPGSIMTVCRQIGVTVHTAISKKSFYYEVVKIRTALQKDDTHSGLSFFEGEHDIPFRITRIYSIYESEQDHQKGFHPHKQSWHLLFCPYGCIDVYIDTGKESRHILLDDPSVGLILHPSVWREMTWKKPGSVLCVAASGHYDSDKLRNDHNAYLKFLKEKEWSAVMESAQITGEGMM